MLYPLLLLKVSYIKCCIKHFFQNFVLENILPFLINYYASSLLLMRIVTDSVVFLSWKPRGCYQFSIVALTNYHKLCGLKQHKFFLSHSSKGQKSNTGLTELKPRCQQGYVPFWSLQGRVCFLAFSSLQKLATCLASFLGYIGQNLSQSFSHCHLSCSTQPHLPLILQRPPLITCFIQIIQITSLSQTQFISHLNSVCNLNFSLPCTCPQIPEIKA